MLEAEERIFGFKHIKTKTDEQKMMPFLIDTGKHADSDVFAYLKFLL